MNPNGYAATCAFKYGTDASNLTYVAPCVYPNGSDTGNGTSNVSVTANLTGLTQRTLYYVRLDAGSTGGSVESSVVSFTTSTLPVAALATPGASAITSATATLSGTVNPKGLATTCVFKYGITTAQPHRHCRVCVPIGRRQHWQRHRRCVRHGGTERPNGRYRVLLPARRDERGR